MQHDEVIWQCINYGHCSFKSKTKTQNFCRNEYNVTGLCNRSSCPLANSRYATIREEKGRCYLYLKTIERAHSPKNLWQKIKLKKSYAQALEQVDSHLQYFPKFLTHKNKQRLTKITQYLIRMRKLAKKSTPALMTMPARKEKQLARKEARAEKALDAEEVEEEDDLEFVEDEEEEEEEEPAGARALQEAELVSDFEESEDDMEDNLDEGIDYDDEFFSDEEGEEGSGTSDEEAEEKPTKRKPPAKPKAGKKPKRRHVEIEYEEEMERVRAKA
eukprot:jgi/Tetstr1/435758/TSEL_024652.t1